jgi:RNA polymerase sigma-70 factor (ECF subfamily)
VVEAAERVRAFEAQVLPHLRAAYTLARWLLRSEQDADDVLQEAMLRAFRAYDGFRGGDARLWLLAVVRNASYSFLEAKRGKRESQSYQEDEHGQQGPGRDETPEVLLLRSLQQRELEEAVAALSEEHREALVLREVEGLSYKEIAQVARIPIGTVMSRLARARKQVQGALAARGRMEGTR